MDCNDCIARETKQQALESDLPIEANLRPGLFACPIALFPAISLRIDVSFIAKEKRCRRLRLFIVIACIQIATGALFMLLPLGRPSECGSCSGPIGAHDPQMVDPDEFDDPILSEAAPARLAYMPAPTIWPQMRTKKNRWSVRYSMQAHYRPHICLVIA